MYLKSIAVQGFKSFPDKTVINFTDGITAIVGPNGSGKSNIVDAIRWVLGEQSSKSLRGAKMEDVIFNGTSKRGQSGYAEVTLCMDNGDSALPVDMSEVTVTRRLYRSGESEYLLCDKPARLKDITEVFMNTGLGKDGYSIIGQGKIAEVLAAKSEERRSIFEEAAGISKYRYRKNEAERKLAATQDNLLRVHDILSELESRIGPLKIQSEKAKAFLAYSGEKKQLEINVWLENIDKTGEHRTEIAEKLSSAQAELDAVVKSYEEDDRRSEELTQIAQDKYVEMDELRESIKELEAQFSLMAKEKAVKENDAVHAADAIDRIKDAISAGGAKSEEYDRQIAEKQSEQEKLRAKIEENERQLAAVTAENERKIASQSEILNDTARLTSEIALLTGKITDAKIELAACNAEVSGQSDKVKSIDEDIEQKEAQKDEQKRLMADVREEYERYAAAVAENENVISGYRKKLESKQNQLGALLEKLQSLENETVQKRHKLELLQGMEQQLEGFAGSVKAVVKEASHGRLKNVYGTVNELISVKSEYALAIETALGGAIQNIIVESENDAKAGMMFLTRERLGRATFLPVTSMNGTPMEEAKVKDEDGYIGIACNLLSFDKKFAGIFGYLLGRTVIVEDIDNAIAIAKKNGYKFRIVTLDGQVVNAGGSFTGGSQIKGAGVLSRRNEIDALGRDIEKLEAEKTALKVEADKLKAETASISATVDGAAAELGVAKESIIRAEGTLNQYKALISALNAAIDELDEQKTAVLSSGTNARKRIEQINSEMQSLEKELARKNAEFDAATAGQNDLAQERETLVAQIAELKLANVSFAKDIEGLNEIIARIEAEKKLIEEEIQNSGEEIKREEQRIAELKAEIVGLDDREREINGGIAEARNRIKSAEEERNAAEKEINEIRTRNKDAVLKRESLAKEVERCQAKKEAIDGEYDMIVSRLWEEYELTLTDAYALRTPLENASAANRRIAELRAKIKNLGAVNVDAVQEYREVKERYDFLNAQVSDLESAKSDLETLIQNLTAEMKKIFIEQFKIINENFKSTFKELFDGGEAGLELSDPTDALSSGIEITACPPGKLIKSLAQLSGGEQALTAISLYFAIMKVRPAPFCLLDEIDSALDDVNVTRLAAYMRRMTAKSQYISITHKRGMMESADILYGVTMQERGVTKLLTMNVSEVEKHFGGKLGN